MFTAAVIIFKSKMTRYPSWLENKFGVMRNLLATLVQTKFCLWAQTAWRRLTLDTILHFKKVRMQKGSGCHTNTHIQHYTLCACWFYLWLWEKFWLRGWKCVEVEENNWASVWKFKDCESWRKNGSNRVGNRKFLKRKSRNNLLRGCALLSKLESSLQVESFTRSENVQLVVATNVKWITSAFRILGLKIPGNVTNSISTPIGFSNRR